MYFIITLLLCLHSYVYAYVIAPYAAVHQTASLPACANSQCLFSLGTVEGSVSKDILCRSPSSFFRCMSECNPDDA